MILPVLLIAGCSTDKAPPKTLTLGTSTSVNSSFVFYAHHLQLFEKAGIKVELIKYPSAARALQDMLDGKIDIAGVAETPLAFAGLQRNDFSIFATLCSTGNDPKIVARRDRLQSPAELIGKRIGTTRKGQSAHFFLHLFLLKHNLSPDQLTIIHDSPSNVVKRLLDGELDAAALFEPYAARAAAGLDAQGEIFAEPGLYYKTFNLVARRDTIDADPDSLDLFVKGLLAGETALKENEEDAIQYLSRELDTDVAVVRKYFEIADFTIFLSNATAITILDEAHWAQQNGYAGSDAVQIPDIRTLFYPDPLRKYIPQRVTIPGY